MDSSEKKAKGVVINIGGNLKRLWFAVGTDSTSEEKFQECCNKIPEIGEQMTDLRTFAVAVIAEFEKNGFENIKR